MAIWLIMTEIDAIRRRAREIVQACRRYHFREAVDIAEASLRLTEHEGFMRGDRLARNSLLVEALAKEMETER